MKKYNNIDDLFREGVSGFRPAPSETLLKDIEASRIAAKRTSRKAVYIWTLVALILLIAGVSGWFFFGNQSDEDLVIKEQMVEEVSRPEPVEEAPQQQTVTIEEHKNIALTTTEPPQQEFMKDEAVFENKAPMQTKADQVDEKESNIISHNELLIIAEESTNLEKLRYRSIYEIAQMEPEPIDPRSVTGMEKYLEKRRNVHIYTGVGATAAMVYYPSTTDQFSWSADIALGIKVHDFYFESGVGYQEMQERGIYQIDFKSRDSIGYYNEVISFEINPQNPDEIAYKTRQTTVYDSVGHYVHTTPLFRYSYLNIPLKTGYRFYQKERFSISAETGIIFSRMLSKEVPEIKLNNPDYQLIAITSQTPERVDINFQWQLSLRMDYHFAKTMSVAVQPVFTKYINSIYDTKAGYPNVKPYTMGVRFGIYFDF